MDMFVNFVGRLIFELKPFLEWALRNWTITTVLLIALIYWVTRRRRLSRHYY